MRQAVFAVRCIPSGVAKPDRTSCPARTRQEAAQASSRRWSRTAVTTTVVNGNGADRLGGQGRPGPGNRLPGRRRRTPAPSFDFPQSTGLLPRRPTEGRRGRGRDPAATPRPIAARTRVRLRQRWWWWWASRSTASSRIAPPKQQPAACRPTSSPTTCLSRPFPAAQRAAQLPGALPDRAAGVDPQTPFDAELAGAGVQHHGGRRRQELDVRRLPDANAPAPFWGIEETRFTDAPILDNPDQQRKLDGRTYRSTSTGSTST